MTEKPKRIIISLGGSLLVPENIDSEFIRSFKKFIIGHVEKGYSFILVTGGGKTARKYIQAASDVSETNDEDKDWLGIHATRMNAHLIRTIFREYAHPRISTNPHDLEDFYNFKESILVAAGWRPGFSTDYISVVLAKYLDIVKIANLSNIDYVYDKDPRAFPDAQKKERMTWAEFRQLVGNEWSPGMNAPFDPIASKLADEHSLEVAIMNGRDLENLGQYLAGEQFRGTVIR